jgi:hypothetical protein
LLARIKVVEQRLPVIAPAQVAVEDNDRNWETHVLRDAADSHGNEMTMEEHVTTTETHLRYAEGHLQPSDEHLADTEEHLKLVKAHLAALEPAGQAETYPVEAVPPTVQEVSTVEAEAVPLPPRKVPTKEAKVASPPREVDISSQQVSGGSASSSE